MGTNENNRIEMQDIMIDFETLGLGLDAAIIQIGAVEFNRYSGKTGKTLDLDIDLDASIKLGFTVGWNTIIWWMNQSEEARKKVFFNEKFRLHPHLAIISLNEFINGRRIWAHLPFDFFRLINHMEKLDIEPSFHFKKGRDLWTLLDLANMDESDFKKIDSLTKHTALDDALYQVNYCVKALRKLRDTTFIENAI